MIFRFGILALLIVTTGCSMLRSMRKESYDDEELAMEARAHDLANRENNAFNQKPLPPAATVLDRSISAQFEGTPVDLSGVRAKSGRVTKADFENLAAKNDNSLWREEGQNNYLFSSNKQRMPGDLITIELEKDLKFDLVKEFKKSLPEEDQEQFFLPGWMKEPEDLPMAAAKPTDPTAPANGQAGAEATPPADGPASATAAAPAKRSLASLHAPAMEVTDTPVMVTGEILQRYPNGNVLLRGVKRMQFGERTRNMEVLAIVKGKEISEDDKVKSSSFFESKIQSGQRFSKE